MTSRFAINIDDGRVVYRTTATDELDVLYKKIDDETANAVIKGEIPGMTVVNAIMAQERFSGVFNWKEYERKRKELNIRTSEVDMPDEEKQPEEKLKEDKPGEVVSFETIQKNAGIAAQPEPETPAEAPAEAPAPAKAAKKGKCAKAAAPAETVAPTAEVPAEAPAATNGDVSMEGI